MTRTEIAAALDREAAAIEATPLGSDARQQVPVTFIRRRPHDNGHVTQARKLAAQLRRKQIATTAIIAQARPLHYFTEALFTALEARPLRRIDLCSPSWAASPSSRPLPIEPRGTVPGSRPAL